MSSNAEKKPKKRLWEFNDNYQGFMKGTIFLSDQYNPMNVFHKESCKYIPAKHLTNMPYCHGCEAVGVFENNLCDACHENLAGQESEKCTKTTDKVADGRLSIDYVEKLEDKIKSLETLYMAAVKELEFNRSIVKQLTTFKEK